LIHRRLFAGLVIGLLSLSLGSAGAAPIEPLPDGDNPAHFDCLGYRWATDPTPGTPEWTDRDRENQYCSLQRYVDRTFQPLGNTAPTYGQDPYRFPFRPGTAGTRFRFDQPVVPGITSLELYRPCPTDPSVCPDLPAGLKRFDPPYPVVVVFHGFTASKELHRWTTQVLAEEGYMAIAVNGSIPYPNGVSISAPNSQDAANGSRILDWLAAGQGLAAQADADRVGFAGHSQGGAAVLSYQGDARVSALVVYDGGTTAAANNASQPVMYQGEDGIAFTFSPPTAANGDGTARTTPEAAEGYSALRSRNVDTMGLSFRAWTHTDYNGNGGPAGNRWAELTSNYFTLAWFDRFIKGKLVLPAGAAERAYRQSIAQDAYDRLRVTPGKLFDDSADRHNISMGFWDPALAASSLDPVFGGNVIYTLEGTPIRNRLSFYAPSVCFISVPDYINGSDGSPGSSVAARADSTVAGDMRLQGCPQIAQ
jgi:dienelactone hydrolase